MKITPFLFLSAFICILYSTVDGQQSLASSCCAATLRSSENRALLDTSYPLVVAPVQSLIVTSIKIQLCSQSPVYVQLWRKNTSSTEEYYILDWQRKFQNNHTSGYAETHDIPSQLQPTITPNHYLGLYTPGSQKIPVKYIMKENGPHLVWRGNAAAPVAGYKTNRSYLFDNLNFPITFSAGIMFCSNNNCPNLGADEPPTVRVIAGPPGPPGPPGNNLDNDVCQKGFKCEVNGDLKREFERINSLYVKLAQVVNDIYSQVRSIANQENGQGVCPAGFFPGSRTVPSCYHIVRQAKTFGSAILNCASLGARLIALNTAKEDSFIANKIKDLDPSQTQKYWTSAMFNIPRNFWVWYDEDTTNPNEIVHENWGPNEPPNFRSTRSFSRLCMKIVTKPDTSFWESADCSDRAYSICETEKICS
ncbi:DgyrCDS1540 [Dimorphilus gyrociliatus]|uniref:DgyrCDS1540 n=1 Tax=Dimorphilus gyrociliatus TaxID=2664684 RepID=A0A7I8VAI9_9ANNE|nr:DgyrCDS1540 [Dimorphilus gyrociliatus]